MDSTDSRDDIDTDRWIKLGELGLEKALVQCGASQDQVSRVVTWLQPADDFAPGLIIENFADVLDIEDSGCVLLATLGRDSDSSGNGIVTAIIEHLEVYDSSLIIYTEFNLRLDLKVGERELGALLVNLARNPKIRRLNLFTQSRQLKYPANAVRFENALTSNTNLLALNLYSSYTSTSQKLLVETLVAVTKNKSLQSLEITAVPKDIDLVAKVVAASTSMLRNLTVRYIPVTLDDGGVIDGNNFEKLADALRTNTSLKSFRFNIRDLLMSMTENPAGTILAAFAQGEEGSHDHHHGHGSPNCTINSLSLPYFPSSAVGPLCSVLRTNRALKTVLLRHSELSPQEWCKILDSLRDNDTLEHLDFAGCLGLTEDIVFDPLMSLLQHTNTALKSFELSGTELRLKEGLIEEELRVNQEYRSSLRSEDTIVPKGGRIVLCGFPFAGKTRICKTLQRDALRALGLKGILQRHPRLRQLLLGKGAHQELYDRTRGLDIIFRGEAPDTISVWDFAGQREFYALHDYVFPNAANSHFLYVCSASHPPKDDGHRAPREKSDVQDDFRYWMRFIASNSKHLKDQVGQIQRPSVTFVMTHLDTFDHTKRSSFRGIAKDVTREVRDEFKTLLDICDTAECIDARSTDVVENLYDVTKGRLERTLNESKEYKVCSTVRDALQRWRFDNPSKPILKLEQVKSLFPQRQHRGERVVPNNLIGQPFEAGLKIILKYLNDVGDIIFVEGLDFVIVQVPWFGHEVLGHLIDPFQEDRAKAGTGMLGCFRKPDAPEDTWTLHHTNGFVRRSILDEFLQRSFKRISSNQAIPSESLIDLMVHLEMCFEEEPGNEGNSSNLDPRFFFPALLGGGTEFGGSVHDVPSTPLEWKLCLFPAERTGVCYVGRRLECKDKLLTFLSPRFFPRLQVVLVKYFRENNWLETEHFVVSQNIIRFATDGMEIIVEYSDIDFFVDVLVQSTKNFQQTLEFMQGHVENKILEFCSSPQGCPGVNLVEGAIRPKCVEALSCLKERKDQSVLVSDLENKEPGYKHTWMHKIAGVSTEVNDYDLAAHLLRGYPVTMPSHGDMTRSKKSIPEAAMKFFFTIKDVEVMQKLEAKMNFGRKVPVKLHILCDGDHASGPHQVDSQPGRVLQLPESHDDFNIPIPKFAFNLLFTGAKTTAAFFNLQTPTQVDRFVEKLCRRTPDIDIDVNTLKDITMNKDKSEPVPVKDILKFLEKYLRLCPDTEWLKQFLSVHEHLDFYRDFQLRRVTNPTTEGITWLCRKHFNELWQSCQ